MEYVIDIAILLVSFLIILTLFFFSKQRKLSKKSLTHKSKKDLKYEILETSDDTMYYEYYEPKIVKILPIEENAK